MKYFILALFLVLWSCKAKNNSVSNERSDQPIVKPTSVAPGQCQVIAELLELDEAGSIVVIKKVVEKGAGFTAQVYKKDTLFIQGLEGNAGQIEIIIESTPALAGENVLQFVRKIQ